ncbi:DsbA family oxidoreductase [Streptomyces sp. MUM 203J]|uniref:DsbA family oxidoreductase n=1 Tax=Streptomyces sp. MUM 203J TaxID=2791990 RepID=UPI001F045D1C|nr:DsbA family oxidoreductase [Streptomyces sp. MUM 203J]MCH0540288.1 DsbA family oxidoreductase [Streptomyces sp. MUM 203J]
MLTVEIWSDIVCPWCYLGKRRWEDALARFPHADEVTTLWRSFELRPKQPSVPGDSLEEMMRRDGHTREELDEIFQWIGGLGKDVGIELRPREYRPVNSFDAHRLLYLALDHGLVHAMKDRLLRAYHSELLNIADHDVLRRLADEAGLPAADVAEVLAGDRYADRVRGDEDRASGIKVTSVPSFVVDGREAVHGMVDSDAMLAMLHREWERHTATAVTDR